VGVLGAPTALVADTRLDVAGGSGAASGNGATSGGSALAVNGVCSVTGAVSTGGGSAGGCSTRSGGQFSIGYTYNENERTEGYGASNGAVYSPGTPRHLLKLWMMATMPDAWSRLRVGGGVNAQSTTYVAGSASIVDAQGNIVGTTPYQFDQKGYAVVSLRGEYGLNDHWSLAVNFNNVLDATYYQTVGSSTGGNYYGEPRNLLFTITSKF
jgi:outer-membrane receptor for ferric coprogen and ferric-rhodotorulic acid